ncbi:MAG TPA: transcriptional regulator [Herpetosiphon sp.]|uniref:helix-turn-helix domain-containing protein n=1 Tax=Herpetosiphon sp. TaxID=71864 RepID=UPI00059E35BD|nr:helix-turn-helix transcriptional regulator [Herpetosiphon sp.]HBW48433.1 transcriptional regulator [Herpetosiphon sp.]
MVRLRLNEVSEQKGFNMSQLQRQSGLTIGMIRRYWYNETTEVNLEALDKLATLLGVTPGELLEHGERKAEDSN